jgi:hypothetical protein
MKREYMEHLDIDGKIILKWIFREIGWRSMDWIPVTHDRDR